MIDVLFEQRVIQNTGLAAEAIWQAVQLYVIGAISFHASSRVIEILMPELSAFDKVPSNNQPPVRRSESLLEPQSLKCSRAICQ